MPCLCTVNTLRFFVRSVAQVDLPTSARHAASRQLRRRQISAFNYAHTTRVYSSGSAQAQFEEYAEYRPLQPNPGSVRSQKDDGLEDQFSDIDKEDAIAEFSPDVIDAIAAEAASGDVEDGYYTSKPTPEYDTPLKSLFRNRPLFSDTRPRKKYEMDNQPERVSRDDRHSERLKSGSLSRDMPPRKKYVEMERVPGTVVRKGRSESEGFKLHYSADPDWEGVEDRRERLEEQKAREEQEAAEAAQAKGDTWVPPPKLPWMVQKERTKEKYPDGYNPLKRLSPDAIAGIRALHAQLPEQYTSFTLAEEFKVSPEAIQRILKSKWRPNSDEQTDREERWRRRGEKVWTRLADMGVKPPKEWREMGIGAGKPEWMKKRENPRPRAPLPALITTARRKAAIRPTTTSSREASLADRII